MQTKKQLKEKHGSPNEFRQAVMTSYYNVEITLQEAQLAINDYYKEWSESKDE